MSLDAFFDKYPEAAIIIFRRHNLWYASLHKDEDGEHVAIARAKNQQVALGNLAAKLLHWKAPQEDNPQ